jgi:hypothetical protein
MRAHMLGILLCQGNNREFGGPGDRDHGGIIARRLRPAQRQFARSLPHLQLHPGIRLESKLSRLENRRGCGAHQILAGIGPTRMAAGKNTGQPIAVVPVKCNVEHGFSSRAYRLILVILISAKGWRWPFSLRTRFFGL